MQGVAKQRQVIEGMGRRQQVSPFQQVSLKNEPCGLPSVALDKDPAYILEIAANRHTPKGSPEGYFGVEVLPQIDPAEQRKKTKQITILSDMHQIVYGCRQDSDKLPTPKAEHYIGLQMGKAIYNAGTRNFIKSLNEYTEEYGVDSELMDTLRQNLKDIDPNGKNYVCAQIGKLVDQAALGEIVSWNEKAFDDAFRNQCGGDFIDAVEQEYVVQGEAFWEKINTIRQKSKQSSKDQIKILQKRIQELYKSISEMIKEPIPEADKERNIKDIEKEIEEIREEIAKSSRML